ncbi:MAG: DUF1269 domain-containing protein [Actinomycetes bacterium]
MSNPVIVLGSYPNRLLAEVDYEQLAGDRRELWDERIYALGLVERTASGKAKVVNHLEPDSNIGAIGGAVVGGLLGLLVPPLIVVTAGAGLGVGRAAAHLWHGVSRKDIAELGTALDSGEGAVLVIAAKLPDNVDSVLPQATHVVHREMQHKHEDIEALVSELRAMHDDDVAASSTPSDA